ncbi:hypothetical protein [Nonomuraea basaltis]|uniref:hypothetical protein n=1 Tax=Nonomuraea basaltis TaxID=2495887 RepID=UPI00110C6AC2|nr:hypothetical protein [Nonomuraea basaltis]TMR97284.1 hypothetical protein EJK15_18585 [Nonomuraea basaltis]
MTSNTRVHVIHLDWGSLSFHETVIMAAPDEPTAYARTARYLLQEARQFLEDDAREAYDDFVTEYPYDPDTATPEQAKEWVDRFDEEVWYPLITVEQVEVRP